MGWDVDSKQISSSFECCCFACFYFLHYFGGGEAMLCFHSVMAVSTYLLFHCFPCSVSYGSFTQAGIPSSDPCSDASEQAGGKWWHGCGEGERKRRWWCDFGYQTCLSSKDQGYKAGEWLQVNSHGWTEAGGRLAPSRTALAASNASNEREICFHVGPFFS